MDGWTGRRKKESGGRTSDIGKNNEEYAGMLGENR
jgi:hypothetical protein